MATNDKSLRGVYSTLKKEGYTPPEYEQFAKDMQDDKNLQGVYNTLKKEGYTPPEYAKFKTDMFGEDAPATPAAEPQGRETSGARPETPSAATTPSAAETPAAEPQGAGAQGGWQPTWQQRMAMDMELRQGMDDFKAHGKELKERTKRVADNNLHRVGLPNAMVEAEAADAGVSTLLMGVEPTTKGGEAGESGEEGKTASGVSPIPHAVKRDKDGDPMIEWLMPDGRLTTDRWEAENAEYVARENRKKHAWEVALRKKGVNPEKPEEVYAYEMRQALEDDEIRLMPGMKPTDVLGGRNIDLQDYTNARNQMKVAMHKLGLDPYDRAQRKLYLDGDYKGIVEIKLKGAESRMKQLEGEYAQWQDAHSESRGAGAFSTPGAVQRTYQADTDTYVNGAANTFPKAAELQRATDEYAALLKTLHDYENGVEANKDENKSWYKQLWTGFKHGLTDPNTWTMGAWGLSAGSGVINAAPGVQDAILALRGVTPETGGWYAGGHFGGQLIGDLPMYAAGGVGGVATKLAGRGLTWAATKTALKGMERKVAERFMMQRLGTRLLQTGVTRTVGGAVNFGTYELLGDMRDQMTNGGWSDDKGNFHQGFSLNHAIHQGGHGALLGSVMGVFGAGFGNLGHYATKAVEPAAGKIATKAGIGTMDVLTEGTIFAAEDIYKFHTMSDEDFDEHYAKKFGYADVTDEKERAKARAEARETMQWNSWGEALSMVGGMKLSGKAMNVAKHPMQTVKSAKEVLDGLKKQGRLDNRTFAERVWSVMDKSPFGITLTKEERQELKDKGYGSLADLLTKKPAADRGGETAGQGKPSPLDGQIELAGIELEEVIEGAKNPLDGYAEVERLIDDANVSQTTRAKVYHLITNNMLPLSTVSGWDVIEHPDGTYTVNAMSADGQVVTTRDFKSKGKADAHVADIRRQAELNAIDLGERASEVRAGRKVFEAAVEEEYPGADLKTVEDIYNRVKSGDEGVTDAMREQVAKIDEAIERNAEVGDEYRPEAMRGQIKEETGIDVDEALKKQDKDRTAEEKAALRTYAERLYPEEARQKAQEESEAYAQSQPSPEQSEAVANYNASRETYSRFESGNPQEQEQARADMDAIGLRYQEALELIDDAFGAEAEMRLAEMRENPWDLVTNPELTADQQEAVLYYINARAALDGVRDAADESAEGKREAVRQAVADRTHVDAGVVIPATMKVDDRQVFIVKGNVVMFEDGTGVDVRNSDNSVIVFDPATGQREFTSPDRIFKVGEAVDPQAEIDNALAEVEAQRNVFPDVEPERSDVSDGSDQSDAPVANVEEYDRGYEDAIEEAKNLSDERVDHYVDVLREGAQKQMQKYGRVDDYIRGRLEALEYVQQDRAGQAVPETEEIVPNPTENPEAEGEIVPEAVSTEQTALERIPRNGDTPIFEKAPDKETAWDGLVEYMENDEQGAIEIAQAQIQRANEDLERLRKKQPKVVTPKLTGDVAAMKAARQQAKEANDKAQEEYQRQIAEAEARQRAWNEIVGVYNTRNAELRRQREEEKQRRNAEAHDAAVAKFEQEQIEQAQKEAERREVGYGKAMPNIVEKYNSAEKVYGNEDEIIIANGEKIKGRWVLSTADATTPSHDPFNGYVKSEGFPMNENGTTVNDRDYEHDIDAQQRNRERGANFDGRALQDPIINSNEGVVVSGNDRDMAGKIAAVAGTDGKYLEYATKYAQKYGFTPEQVAAMPHARIRFEMSEPIEYTTENFHKFNVDDKKAKNNTEKAVEMGKVISDELYGQIVNRLNGFDTIGEYYNDPKAGYDAVQALVSAGVIGVDGIPELIDGGKLSEQGKKLLESILVGKAFSADPNVVRILTDRPAMRQRVVWALQEIADNYHLGADYSLQQEMTAAIHLCDEALNSGFQLGDPVSGFAAQKGLFPELDRSKSYQSVTVQMLGNILNHKNVSELKKALTSYNDNSRPAASGQFSFDFDSGDIKRETKEEIIKQVLEFLQYGTKEQIENARQIAVERRKESVQQDGDAVTVNPTSATEREGINGSSQDQAHPVGGAGDRSIDEWFGPVYTEFQGKPVEAEEYLRDVCEGVAKGALSYPGLAPIDLAWGDKKAGYMKVVIKHPEVVGKLQEILNSCKIIEQSNNRVVLESDTHRVIVSKMKGSTPTDNWLLTAYEKKKKPVSASSSDIETEPEGKRNGTATPQGEPLSDGKVNTLSEDKQVTDAESSKKEKKNSVPDNTTDTGETLSGNGNDTATPKSTVISDGKDNTFFANDQKNKEQSDLKVDESEDKQASATESSKDYTISPATYTNKKGKETPMHRLEFDRELSKDEEAAIKKFASEKTGEGRFAPARGWKDRENGGWLFRTEEDARKAAEMIGNEEAVADNQPLSREDIASEARGKSQAGGLRSKKAPINRVDVEGLIGDLKGASIVSAISGGAVDVRLSEHAVPVEPKKPSEGKRSLQISDEMKADEDILRDLLGIDDEEIGDVHFRDTDGLTPEQKRKVYAVGVNYSLGYFDQGIVSFPDFAQAMVGRLGQKIKPWLKSFYEGAKRIPGYDESRFTPTEEVDRFDVANFDKPSADVLRQAEVMVAERKAREATAQAEKEITETRNQKRKEHDKQTETDTAALGEKAEAVASEAESVAETGADRGELNRAAEEIDETLDELGDQLAVLGYYEADFDAPEHEVFGLRRSAEKKAVKDAKRLATQLINDLGIDLAQATTTTTTDRKGKRKTKKKPLAVSNLTRTDGDVTINLPMPDGRNLHINIGLQPTHERGIEPKRGGGAWEGDNLEVDCIMYRFDRLNGRGDDNNHFLNPDVTYAQMLADIQRTAKWGMPKREPDIFDKADEVAAQAKAKREATKEETEAIADLLKGGKPKDEKKSVSSRREVKPEQPIGDLFSGLYDEPQTEKADEKTDLQPRTGTGEREGGHQPQQNEPLGESQRNEAERTDGRGVDRGSVEHPLSDTERSRGVSRLPQGAERIDRLPEGERRNTRNNHAERGVDYAPKGEDGRIKANLDAIRLAKQLLESGESATPQQMEVLRKFSGWGGLGKAFNEKPGGPYAPANPIVKELKELLGEEGYADAEMSRNSAYFTPAVVIGTMWDIVKSMGFKGGKVLEGSAGIGNILGLMPRDLSDRSDIHAVEVDRTTGGILSLLYPDAKVDIQGFEQTKIRNNSVDLAITNVPFVTGLHVIDETGDKDLSKKFRDIHDFCIAKNIRKLKEGGIGIFITSSGTMDNSARLRAWIGNEGNADVVGAFRLHNKTFGGTPATSDIIVVRKRVNGRVSPNAIDITDVTGVRVAEFDTGDTRKVKGVEVPIIKRMAMEYNKYFAEHPENMAGEMMFNFEKGVTYHPTSRSLFPVEGKEQSAMLKAWAERMAELADEGVPAERVEETRINEQLGEGVKEGSMVLNSQGELCMARMGEAVPLGLNKNKVKGHTKAECFKAYTAIKKALADVLEYQSSHDDDAGLEPLLKELNRAFDSFTRTYGNLHKNTAIAFLRNDVDFSSIFALETYSEKGDKKGNKVVKVGKTDIFSRRVIDTEKEPQPTTIKDGILASLYKTGGVDADYIAQALGMSVEDVKREIVKSGLGFENPANGTMEVSYQYLSGNVREKLHIAQENNEDGRYDTNISALQRALPMTIPAHLIEFSIGSSWIDPKLYEAYVEEKTGLKVRLTNVGGTWIMKTPWSTYNEKNRSMGVVSKLCNKTIMGHELIESAMTNRSITVSKTERHYDGTSETITDREATSACMARVDDIRAEFKDWAREKMQSDPEMSAVIEATYNERFNNYAPMRIPDEFVPKHFGGQVSELHGKAFALRPHQGKAVVRGTTEPVLLAHEVGTGKTFTLISTAMEMRRLGTARKPMIVVQNATVGQFVESAKEIYPNAKVLTIEEADRTSDGRKNFYAKIKYNDWDMIIVPQSVFERIPDSEERQMAYVKDFIEEKTQALEAMREADDSGRNPLVRRAERELEDLQEQLANLTESLQKKNEGRKDEAEPTGRKRDGKREAKAKQNAEVKAKERLDREVDDVENFDDMGIDAILVDEAHEYKHLGFATAMQRGVKGIDPSYSKKALGVYLKAQAVMERNNGRNVVFATGTPISNTAAEIWTFMRYLMPADRMKEYGIYYFDDFVRNFGDLAQRLEFINGKFKEVCRFAGYVNLPELVRIWSSVADTVLTRDAGDVSDKIPELEGGKAQDIYLPQTKALRSVMKFIRTELERYEQMTGKDKKENSHIPITMYGIGVAAAVDARLVLADAEDDPNSKTNAAVREALRSLNDSKKYNGTVAIFADHYYNRRSGFNLYEDIRDKLIAAGVPESQVVIIKGGNSMSVKKKLEIFDKVNAGEIRVVLGSTYTLGTGVNIQERLHTLIHVDAPGRPMDYTQRNGRILRQGNLHKDMGIPVRVIRLGVEDSADVSAYQKLKTKGAIADSIMNGSELMNNSMENRVMSEEEDQYGDMLAQLSGSEYAMLKNQAEREVRNLTSKQKQHEIDQIHLHNSIPTEKGFIAGAERRIGIETANLETIGKHFPEGKITKVTIGKLTFGGIDAMEDFFKEQNAKKKEASENVEKTGDAYHSSMTINVNGLDFVVTTDIDRVVSNTGQMTLDTSTAMTLTCDALQLKESVPYMRVKEAMKIIAEDVATGNKSRKLLSDAQYSLSSHSEQLQQMEARYGKEFPYTKELADAKKRLEEYTEKMREEMEAKEKKYAEMDKSVEAASNVELTDEDEAPAESNGDKTRFRVIDEGEDELLSFLNSQPLKKGYRYAQWADMGVRPPMTAKVNGEWRPPMIFSQWEQSEEGMRKANGKADLVQGNGRTTRDVAYNPYFHIRTSPLNDQFTAAYDRPELIVVEGYYPESEETSGYQAEGAEDSVGLMDWHSGSVNGQLSDATKVQTMLSRYFKPSRIVPWSEVADLIMERVGNQKITFPINAVPPMLRAELAKRGARFGDVSGQVAEGDIAMLHELRDRVNAGEHDAGLEKAQAYLDAYDSSEEAKEDRGKALAKKLNLPVRFITTREEAEQLPTARKRNAKGFYDESADRRGETAITVVLPNHVNVADVVGTILHEGVWHKGIRLFCKDETELNNLLDHLYGNSSKRIVAEIDAEADAMYKRTLDIKKRKYGNDVFGEARAVAETERMKREGKFRRDATEEFGARVTEEIKDGDFEKMSEDRLSFFGKIYAFVEKAISKILAGLNVRMPKKYVRKDWRIFSHLFYERLRKGETPEEFEARTGKEWNPIFEEAERVAARFKDERKAENKKPTWQETCYALTDSPQPHQKDAGLDSQTKSDVAKIQKISERLKIAVSEMPKEGYGRNGLLYELAKALGATIPSSSNSNYAIINIAGVGNTTVRVSNHSAIVGNFNQTSNNVGIVIKTSNNRFRNEEGVDYVEFMYYGDKVEGDGNRQRAIIDGLRHYIETGSFEKMPEVDRLNTSGRYREAVDGLEDVVYFRDGGLGLEEAITKMKAEAAQANTDNLQARRDAMRAIGGNLNHLRQAMARQREYDVTTVKSITDLAKVLLEANMLDDLSKYEVKRILSAVNNVVGRQDVSRYVEKVMDIMVDNQLRMGANALGKLLTIKGSRVDARGIEVQGELDPEGVAIAKVVRKATPLPKDEIDNLIADAIDRMSSSDTAIADEATIQYAGLQIARQFVENITESKAEEKLLRESIKQAKAEKDAGQMDDTAYKQYVAATEDAIRQNKIERAESYRELVGMVGDTMSESIERAKAWREGEKQRVGEIHHNANSDMEGRPTDEHHKNDRTQKLANNSAVRFLLAPLATFDQMLRMFGRKNVRGEGYLWNRYMRGWVEATEKEYTGYRDALKRLDDKVSEVYGKKMQWGDLFSIDRKLPKASVRFMDGGEMKEHELTQGNLLYIYMADKMSDGRMKLRKMGITESDIEDIKDFLVPTFIELADWMQEEFLVEKRNEYNEVHKRMFGASMAAIENYFPLKILSNARMEEVDVADDTTDTALPATSTGSIIKRRRNNLALDVTGANAFSVILDHLQQMERWAAFAEYNRDLNTLLSYKRFRNQVMNMSSVYGGGKTLWNNFRNVASMSAGAYRPPIAALDKAAVNIAKGVTAAKVSFRIFTSLKQLLSLPAYLSDCNPLLLAKSIATPWIAWKWSMKNLPIFEKRWRSRMAGDPRLLKTEMDWKAWRSNIVQLASRVGMSPNAFVDALTVSIGARAMYETKLKKYLRWGMSQADAEKRAKQDTTILFNQTQQSSEGAFLSTMQVDRSWLSVLFTVFRNAGMSYTRQQYDAIRNLARRLQPGYAGLSEEFMAKQMRRDGIDPDKADTEAKREYRRGIIRDFARLAVFGFGLQLAWNMGAYLPYLLLGDDDEEKEKMWDDIFNHTYFGSVEGLTGGDVMSAAGQMALNGEGNWSNLTKDMPLAGDLANIYRKIGKDNVSAMNDVVNLLAQSTLGVNPQTLTDAVVAVIDACGDDTNSQRECALLITRIINCPQSQVDKLYFDELGLSGEEASKMTPAEIAERYAQYKTMRNAPLTGWAYSDEGREEQMDKYRKKVITAAREGLTEVTSTDAVKELLSEYDEVTKREAALGELKKEQKFEEYREGMRQLRGEHDMRVHRRVGRYKRDIRELTERYLTPGISRAEADSIVGAIGTTRDKLLEDVGRLTAQ